MKEYIERELAVKQLEFGLTKCALSTTDDEYEEQYKIGDISAREDDIHSIKLLPAADVEPVRHGKWVERSDKGIVGDLRCPYMCSICGRVEAIKEPYCNCGAKMDGVDKQ